MSARKPLGHCYTMSGPEFPDLQRANQLVALG